MKKLALLFAFCGVAAFGAEWTGYVSCAKCGAKHNDGSQASISCVKGCLKGGVQPVLVVGDKIIKISNPAKVPESLYGLKVAVKGDLKGDAVQIASIAALK
ncbi:MAG TPA: hypothetical protein VME17_25730 [Bryobacteraceae bacterium]|nr:hypothetical protein [Bryobacteraceae bacterium]